MSLQDENFGIKDLELKTQALEEMVASKEYTVSNGVQEIQAALNYTEPHRQVG